MFWLIRRPDDSRAGRPAGTVEAQRSFWQHRLDRLAEYLKRVQREKHDNPGQYH